MAERSAVETVGLSRSRMNESQSAVPERFLVQIRALQDASEKVRARGLKNPPYLLNQTINLTAFYFLATASQKSFALYPETNSFRELADGMAKKNDESENAGNH